MWKIEIRIIEALGQRLPCSYKTGFNFFGRNQISVLNHPSPSEHPFTSVSAGISNRANRGAADLQEATPHIEQRLHDHHDDVHRALLLLNCSFGADDDTVQVNVCCSFFLGEKISRWRLRRRKADFRCNGRSSLSISPPLPPSLPLSLSPGRQF